MTAPAAARVPDVERAIDEMHRPAFHVMLLARCGLCLVIGGFDAQAMGYVAPSATRATRAARPSSAARCCRRAA